MTDIETRLQDAARQWRAQQNNPAPFDPTAVTATPRERRSVARRWGRPGPVLAGVVAVGTAVILVIAVVVVRAAIGGRGGQTSTVTGAPAVAPIATKPLLAHVPRPTKPILVASGQADGAVWTFYAQVNPLTANPLAHNPPTTLAYPESSGPGLNLSMSGQPASGVGGGSQALAGDPRSLPSLVSQAFGPQLVGFDAELIYGVTSTPASTVSLTWGNLPPVVVATISKEALPGLRFFAAQAPPAAEQPGLSLEIVAEAADGRPLVRSDPMPPPPVNPPVGGDTSPGTYPLWPLDGTAEGPFDTAMAVARSFSDTVLGVTGNTITSTPGVPTALLIHLPASGRSVSVSTTPGLNQSWTIEQVGAPLAQGVSYGSGRPTITITPPHGATQADVTELADGVVHQIHVTPAQFHAGVVPLAGTSVEVVILVYRNAAGDAVDAAGSEFG